MSSSASREPLAGLIRQNDKVVGAVALPEEDLNEFIEQFNSCYGPLRMQIEPPEPLSYAPSCTVPVGAHRPRKFVFPFRPKSPVKHG